MTEHIIEYVCHLPAQHYITNKFVKMDLLRSVDGITIRHTAQGTFGMHFYCILLCRQ